MPTSIVNRALIQPRPGIPAAPAVGRFRPSHPNTLLGKPDW